jgi:hypothetical protein
MEPTGSDIQTAKDKLDEYAEKITSGEDLHPKKDALEMDVPQGRIWLHPNEDGTTVDIHLFDDTDEREFGPARARLQNHISRELNAPIHGECEPYTPFIGNERMNIRVDLKYLRDR